MYIPYLDAKKKMEVISIKHILGKNTKEIAEDMGISEQDVSYYKKKMGISRPREPAKNRIPVCVVCRKRPISDSVPHICSDPSCISIFLNTMSCSNSIRTFIGGEISTVDSDTKIALDILPKITFTFHEGVKVCVRDDVTRVFNSLSDHIKYHAYAILGREHRPPVTLWKDKDEEAAYRIRKKDAEYVRRNKNSEYPQPERLRYAR